MCPANLYWYTLAQRKILKKKKKLVASEDCSLRTGLYEQLHVKFRDDLLLSGGWRIWLWFMTVCMVFGLWMGDWVFCWTSENGFWTNPRLLPTGWAEERNQLACLMASDAWASGLGTNLEAQHWALFLYTLV